MASIYFPPLRTNVAIFQYAFFTLWILVSLVLFLIYKTIKKRVFYLFMVTTLVGLLTIMFVWILFFLYASQSLEKLI